MKLKSDTLPIFTFFAGLAGLGLRLWLLCDGIDHKGLLETDHPALLLTVILTAIVLAVLGLSIRPLEPMDSYPRLFPGWNLAGLGCMVAASGILYTNIRELTVRQDLITVVTLLVGLAASVSLVLLGILRWRGHRPHYLLHCAVTVYCMLHLVSQYRMWSGEPQLAIYVFPLLASVFLMLTAYHSAVLDAHKGKRRWFVFCNQAALFFCCLSIPGDSWPFYLAMAFWMVSGICNLSPGQPAEHEEPKE